MRTRLRVLGVATATAVAAVAVPLVTSSEAHAARFTGGDVVVYRVGYGRVRPLERAAPVFLDEYGPTGTKVQSVALPTPRPRGTHRLTATGQSRSEGLIDRSVGRPLRRRHRVRRGARRHRHRRPVAGDHRPDPDPPGPRPGRRQRHGRHHHRARGRQARPRSSARPPPPTVSGSGPPAATAASSPPPAARAPAAPSAGGDASNLSALTVQGGQLFSSGILTDRLAAVGSGTPTTGSLTDLTGLPDNLLTYGYAFADLTSAGFGSTGLDTLYVADGSSRGGTIDKYRWNGTTWTAAGDVDVPGAFGVVANVTGQLGQPRGDHPDPAGHPHRLQRLGRVVHAAARRRCWPPPPRTPSSAAWRSPRPRPPAPRSSCGRRCVGAPRRPGQHRAGHGVRRLAGRRGRQSRPSSAAARSSTATQSGHLWTANVPTSGLAAGAQHGDRPGHRHRRHPGDHHGHPRRSR